jgi:hypothetical protein
MDRGTVLHEARARAHAARRQPWAARNAQLGFARKPLNSHDSRKKEAWISLPLALDFLPYALDFLSHGL